jgi:crossover junction endodeoxyribonuclease RusA
MPMIVLPYPPSVNTYWRHVVIGRHARVLISRAGREYQANVQAEVLSRWGVLRPTEDRLQVTVTTHAPTRRRMDLDNVCKALLDALTAAQVWRDDSQIDRLTVIRGPVRPPGCVEVEIERIEGERGLF